MCWRVWRHPCQSTKVWAGCHSVSHSVLPIRGRTCDPRRLCRRNGFIVLCTSCRGCVPTSVPRGRAGSSDAVQTRRREVSSSQEIGAERSCKWGDVGAARLLRKTCSAKAQAASSMGTTTHRRPFRRAHQTHISIGGSRRCRPDQLEGWWVGQTQRASTGDLPQSQRRWLPLCINIGRRSNRLDAALGVCGHCAVRVGE